MSLGQQVRLDLEDGREIQVTYDGRDIRAWEARHRKSALVEAMSLSMLTWLGHHAAVRTGAINGDLSTYDAFDKVCASVEGIKAEEPPDPTQAEETKRKTKASKASPRSPGGDS